MGQVLRKGLIESWVSKDTPIPAPLWKQGLMNTFNHHGSLIISIIRPAVLWRGGNLLDSREIRQLMSFSCNFFLQKMSSCRLTLQN